jgi:predicted DNA-binding transcriptional regulator
MNGKLHYKVKWVGYTDSTWEPYDNLHSVKRMVKEFEREVEKKMDLEKP